MAYNMNLSLIREDIAISRYKNEEAKANLLPKVALTGEYKYYIDLPYQFMPADAFGGPEDTYKAVQFGVPHNINASFQVSLPLYNPQMYGNIKASQINMEITDLQYQKMQEQVFWEVSNLYYNAQVVLNSIKLLEKNVDNLQILFNNTVLLQQHKLAKESDANRVKLQLEEIKLSKEKAWHNYQQILNLLKLSMGFTLEKSLEIEQEVEIEDIEAYERYSIIDEQLAIARNNLSLIEMSNIKKGRLPTVNALGVYGTSGFGFTEQPNDFLDFFGVGFVGLSISYPIFNGAVTQKRIHQKQAQVRQSEINLELISTKSEIEIYNALNKQTMAKREKEMADAHIGLAETNYKDVALQYKEGIANLTDVLLSDNELQQAHQNYISAMVDFLRSDLELKKLTGNILNRN
jgi:OMF family outer membrane factor